MKKLKHYRDSWVMKLCNMIIEYMLIISAYFVSGEIRRTIPVTIARPFASFDVTSFVRYAFIGAIVAVVIYFVLGDYQTIHYRRMDVEGLWILLTQLVNGFVISALLYWEQGGQFSRVWLLLFMLVSSAFLFGKRLVFHYGADIVLKKYLPEDRLLVVGSGEMAHRFIKAVGENKNCRYSLCGYLAEVENKNLSSDTFKYIGNLQTLQSFIQEENKPERIVVCDEMLKKDCLKTVLYTSSIFGVQVFVIPMFNDYLMGEVRNNFREDLPGIHLFPVSAMNTDDILGVNIAVTNMDKTVEDIEDHISDWKGEYICVSNVHTTVMAHDNSEYRSIQNNAVIALPDGGPLSAHSRSTGNVAASRVTGPDLMRELLIRGQEKGYKHFFYGSTEKTLELLQKKIKEKYPQAQIVGTISPPFRDLTPEEDKEFVDKINAANPDFLWVGLGAPKQEIWMAAHRGRIDAIMIGVGAAFDYESGNLKRAPLWMQKASLEWLYRLLQDPKRLFKRYLVTNVKYLWLTRK